MNSPQLHATGPSPGSSGQNRRKFLQITGAATATVALTTPGAFAAGTSARKIRLGVVGGNFGRAFYWHEHPDCVVAAVSDLIPARREALMKTYRCSTAYESLEKLILD